ncbi:hypothetical protein HED51_15440 [Ochrobactrum grignonense]|nr:hypothetical protein [Brucella grignonensis]
MVALLAHPAKLKAKPANIHIDNFLIYIRPLLDCLCGCFRRCHCGALALFHRSVEIASSQQQKAATRAAIEYFSQFGIKAQIMI